MACRQPGSIESILRSSSRALIALALVAAPIAAGAARLSQVRVGTHEDHTRIVLELDEAASYRLAPGGSQIQIQLDADSAARHVASRSPLVKAVRVEPSQRGSLISIDLTKADVEVSEMVLANPPRIVLDVKPAGSMAAMTAPPVPAPKPAPAAPPAPAPKTAAAPAPTPAPSAAGRLNADGKPVEAGKPVAPKTGAPSLSDPVPNDIVSKPSARFEAPAAPPATVTATAPAARPAPARPEKPAIVNPEIAARSAATPEPSTTGATSTAAPGATAALPAAPRPVAEEPRAEPQRAPSAKPAEIVVRKATPPTAKPAAADSPSWTERLTSPVGYAAIGGVLLALVVLAVRRRRRDEDDDPLYSVMSADDAGAADDDQDLRGQEPAVEWGHREEPEAEPAYAATRFDADEPISRDGSQQLALGRLRASEEDEPAASDPDSLFDGPGAPAIATPPAAPAISNAYASDASQAAGELESRMKDLERRIEQLTEARERLERQVAAQTEELRVQRAAIARTQRVVRSMTKGEDLATEPVPRAPQA